MSPNEARLMKFAIRLPGWHSCQADARRTMRRLGALGLLEVAEHGRKAQPQFRLALSETVRAALESVRE